MRLSSKHQKWISALFASMLLAFSSFSGNALAADKPFAEQRVVLQISDDDPSKQTLVLNVASNLIKHYGQDKVDVEIVAFGPGLRLMFADNVNSGRIKGLDGSGVRFAACSNTHTKMTEVLGNPPKMDPHSVMVDAGVVRIVDLVKEGYTLVKP